MSAGSSEHVPTSFLLIRPLFVVLHSAIGTPEARNPLSPFFRHLPVKAARRCQQCPLFMWIPSASRSCRDIQEFLLFSSPSSTTFLLFIMRSSYIPCPCPPVFFSPPTFAYFIIFTTAPEACVAHVSLWVHPLCQLHVAFHGDAA